MNPRPAYKAFRSAAKRSYSRLRLAYVHALARYDAPELIDALSWIGIAAGDTLLMHSRFTPFNGFVGSPGDVIQAVRYAIGENGTLAMVSLPYRGASREYLQRNLVFDVGRTPSHMGIVTEVFRRMPGVSRSLSPTHPVLAIGPRAQWLTGGHENCLFPFGDESPFAKMHECGAKILFFDLPFIGFTFFHYLEHYMRDRLAYPLYDERTFLARVRRGPVEEVEVVQVRALAPDPVKKERVIRFIGELRARGLTVECRLGGTFLGVVTVRDCVEVTRQLFAEGYGF